MDITIKLINYLLIKQKFLIFCFAFILLACNKNDFKKNNLYTIDLTTVYNDRMNSYKIDIDGNAVVLLNKINEPGKLYKVKFTMQEVDSIQKEFIKISSKKCDSLEVRVFDGTRYAIILENTKNKIYLRGNICSNYEGLDKLVFSIINKIEKMHKEEYYGTFDQMSAPLIKL